MFKWEYCSEFYSSENHFAKMPNQATLECPDFFKLEDKWVLKFLSQKYRTEVLVLGDFDKGKFIPDKINDDKEIYFDAGKELFAMQTFANLNDRTIAIGWMWNWEKETPKGYENRIGTMTIPREFFIKNGRVYNYPIKEAVNLLKKQHEKVFVDKTTVTIYGLDNKVILQKDIKGYNGLTQIDTVEILEDGLALEIFINGGQVSITKWLL